MDQPSFHREGFASRMVGPVAIVETVLAETAAPPPAPPAPAWRHDAAREAPADIAAAQGGRRVRDRLLGLIAARPGINKISACQTLGVAWGTISYHVDRLRRTGRIEVEHVGRDAALFPVGMSPSLKRSSLALREDAARRLLGVLAQWRQGSLGELSRALGVSRKVGRRLILDLVAAGLLANQRTAGRPRYVLQRSEAPAQARSLPPRPMAAAPLLVVRRPAA